MLMVGLQHWLPFLVERLTFFKQSLKKGKSNTPRALSIHTFNEIGKTFDERGRQIHTFHQASEKMSSLQKTMFTQNLQKIAPPAYMVLNPLKMPENGFERNVGVRVAGALTLKGQTMISTARDTCNRTSFPLLST